RPPRAGLAGRSGRTGLAGRSSFSGRPGRSIFVTRSGLPVVRTAFSTLALAARWAFAVALAFWLPALIRVPRLKPSSLGIAPQPRPSARMASTPPAVVVVVVPSGLGTVGLGPVKA